MEGLAGVGGKYIYIDIFSLTSDAMGFSKKTRETTAKGHGIFSKGGGPESRIFLSGLDYADFSHT